MARRCPRPSTCRLLLLAFLWNVAGAHASQVRLKSGEVYTDATVLRRDSAAIEIRVRYGTMTLPLARVESIDGVLVTPPATPPARSPSPTIRPATPTPALAVATAMPTAGPSTPAAARPTPAVPQPASYDEQQGLGALFMRVLWLILGVIVVLFLWSLTLPRLNRDRREGRVFSRWWYLVVLGVPVWATSATSAGVC